MDFKVVWTERALSDLEWIVKDIAIDNPSAAERVGNDIIDRVERLQEFPMIGPKYPPGSHGRIREVVCHDYRILYRTNKSRRTVEVLTVWHGARREPDLGSS